MGQRISILTQKLQGNTANYLIFAPSTNLGMSSDCNKHISGE